MILAGNAKSVASGQLSVISHGSMRKPLLDVKKLLSGYLWPSRSLLSLDPLYENLEDTATDYARLS